MSAFDPIKKDNPMANKQQWLDYADQLKKYAQELKKWAKKLKDDGEVSTQGDSTGSNPPPPPPPPPGSNPP